MWIATFVEGKRFLRGFCMEVSLKISRSWYFHWYTYLSSYKAFVMAFIQIYQRVQNYYCLCTCVGSFTRQYIAEEKKCSKRLYNWYRQVVLWISQKKKGGHMTIMRLNRNADKRFLTKSADMRVLWPCTAEISC